jgi:uncharacterized protein (TIGR03067 family)
MRLPSLVLLAAVTLTVGFAPVPPPKEKKPKESELSLKGLEGTWTVVSYEVGRINPKAKAKAKVNPKAVKTKSAYQTVEIKDGKWVQKRTLASGKTSQTLPYSILLDTTKSPPTFDLTYEQPAPKAKAKAKVVVKTTDTVRQGLARLEGDQLTVTFSLARRERPTSVDAELTTGQHRWVLKRAKP